MDRLRSSAVILFSAFIYVFAACGSNKGQSIRPNILVIVADDLGYADMSFLPHAPGDVSTPNIDRLAESGVYFSEAYATAPICSPSRAGLLTGRFQQRWGNYWYGEGGLPADEKTLPQMLRDLGYYTVKIGKTHLNGGPVEHPLDHGFDDFLGFIDHTWDYLRLSQDDVDAYGDQNAKLAHIGPLLEGREKRSFKGAFTTDIFTEKAVEIIKGSSPQPWYVELAYNAVHHPTYVCHPDYLAKYGIDQFPFWNPEEQTYHEWHQHWGHLGKIDPDGRKRYLSHLEVMDDGIGKILDALEDLDVRNNTMVVFLSDNGGTINTYANNRPLNGYKYMFAEGGIRIPMIISYPQRVDGSQNFSDMVSAMDVLPTILDAVGGEIPKNLDGVNLWPVIAASTAAHTSLFWADGRGQYVVRKGRWKLVESGGWTHANFSVEKGRAMPAQDYEYPKGTLLFDLENDLGEAINLADIQPEVVNELEAGYQEWRRRMSDPRTRDGKLKKKTKK